MSKRLSSGDAMAVLTDMSSAGSYVPRGLVTYGSEISQLKSGISATLFKLSDD